MSTENQGSARLLKELTSDTRNNIISLDQKLRGLRAEIEAKMHASTLQMDEPSPELNNTMHALLNEINQAIDSISVIVSATMDDVGNPEYFKSDEMNEFNQDLTQFLAKIKQLHMD